MMEEPFLVGAFMASDKFCERFCYPITIVSFSVHALDFLPSKRGEDYSDLQKGASEQCANLARIRT